MKYRTRAERAAELILKDIRRAGELIERSEPGSKLWQYYTILRNGYLEALTSVGYFFPKARVLLDDYVEEVRKKDYAGMMEISRKGGSISPETLKLCCRP